MRHRFPVTGYHPASLDRLPKVHVQSNIGLDSAAEFCNRRTDPSASGRKEPMAVSPLASNLSAADGLAVIRADEINNGRPVGNCDELCQWFAWCNLQERKRLLNK